MKGFGLIGGDLGLWACLKVYFETARSSCFAYNYPTLHWKPRSNQVYLATSPSNGKKNTFQDTAGIYYMFQRRYQDVQYQVQAYVQKHPYVKYI